MTHQGEFDFDRDFDELLVAIRELELSGVPLPPGRLGGVIELLTRILILSRKSGQPSIRASVPVIAGGITGRRRVSDRTVNNWTRDAKAVGLMEVIVASRIVGRTTWNTWIVHWHRVRNPRWQAPSSPPVEVRNGPKWSESISDPGSEKVSDLLQALRKAKTAAAEEEPAAGGLVSQAEEEVQATPAPRRDICAVAAERPPIRTLAPPPAPTRQTGTQAAWTDAEIAAGIALLRDRSVGWDEGAIRFVREIAHDGRCTPEQLRLACRSWQLRTAHHVGPGAIHARIVRHAWPHGGIRDWSAEELLALDQRRAAEAQAAVDRSRREASARAAAQQLQAAREAAWQALTDEARGALIARARAANSLLSGRPDSSLALLLAAQAFLEPAPEVTW